VKVSEFDYRLPEDLIAAEPLPERAASRLLHFESNSGVLHNLAFRNFPDLLRPDDLIVFNNTKVFPARLYGRRSGSKAQRLSPRNTASRDFLKGQVEVLLTKQISQQPNEWECLVRPGRKIGVGEQLYFGTKTELQAQVTARGRFGERRIRFEPVESFFDMVQRIGHVPLPPYIKRPDRPEDREWYQTVYAREPGSVAAPTAGLHFTPAILGRIRERGIEAAEITLHVGLGTFQPIRTPTVEKHKLHSEAYSISQDAAGRINRAVEAGRRIVAIGTTTVRTLEHSAKGSGVLKPGNAEADIFIYPGHQFRIVGALLTNFHLPRSTLLMLVCAFGGKGRVLAAYRHAVEHEYRFYSYGDCMFIESAP
jgi:S-adenosylmethionine:tRNA ribosyltransferase-isomerase